MPMGFFMVIDKVLSRASGREEISRIIKTRPLSFDFGVIVMQVQGLDHLVLTVRSIDDTVQFYTSVLGMQKITFGEGRVALVFGDQKINLHALGHEFEPKAQRVQAGSADLCFVVDQPIEQAIAHLQALGVTVIDGPVLRTGARGKIVSAYCRDPDGNLIEISNYCDPQ